VRTVKTASGATALRSLAQVRDLVSARLTLTQPGSLRRVCSRHVRERTHTDVSQVVREGANGIGQLGRCLGAEVAQQIFAAPDQRQASVARHRLLRDRIRPEIRVRLYLHCITDRVECAARTCFRVAGLLRSPSGF